MARVGIFGAADDLQVRAVARECGLLGLGVVVIPPDAFERGGLLSFDGARTIFGDDCLDDLQGYYVRAVPVPQPPVERQADGAVVMYRDWYTAYMHSKERAAFFTGWLLQLQQRGVRLLNGPQAGAVAQSKPFQLEVLRSVGATVPETLITNDPARVRAFASAHPDAIFKPMLGGAITQPLDAAALERLGALGNAPVTFQSRAPGDDLRVMMVGGEVVSSVAIETPAQHLDFRADPAYQAGQARYREVTIPEHVVAPLRRAAAILGLEFAGIDIKHAGDAWVVLELNSSPIYLDVELKLGHGISRAIARRLADV